jgi:hypothetical protein
MIFFETYAAAQSATGITDNAIALVGYYCAGDAPMVIYRRVAAQPSHQFALSMSDGSWWEGVPAPHIDLRWCGAVLDSVTDDRNAMLAALGAAQATKCYSVHVPRSCALSGGEYLCNGVTLHGVDPNRTVMQMTSPKSIAPVKFRFTGANGVTAGGMRRLCIWSPGSANAGTGIYLGGDATFQPDESIFEDIKITGSGCWDYPMFLYGSARQGSPPGQGLLGLRDVTIRNAFLAKANYWALYAECVEGLATLELNTFVGMTANGNGVLINGNATVPSHTVQLIGCNVQGTAWFYYTVGAVVCGYTGGCVFSTGTIDCWNGGADVGSYSSAGTNNLNTAS